jgi:HAE1 family hydrophobic/amphiphilic exporter-1
MDAKTASFEGTKEVLVAVFATSLTVLAVFYPVTFIPGIVGRFFSAFALTVCIGIVLSTFDAITMAPMLSANLMRAGGGAHHGKRNFVLEWLEGIGGKVSSFYEKTLHWSLKRPWITISIAVAMLFASLYMLKFVGFTFLPDDESGEIDVNLEALPGTSFQKMHSISKQAEDMIKEAVPEIALISTKVGNETEEVNFALSFVKLVPYAQRDRTTSEVKNAIRLKLRPLVENEQLIVTIANAGNARGGKPVSMVVQGSDNKTLQTLAQKIIETANQQVQGVANLETNLKPGRQELQLAIDRQNASAFGLRSSEIGENVRGLYEGLLAGVYRDGGEEYDIRVRLKNDQRADTRALEGLTIPNERGDAVPLKSVVRVQNDASPTSIVRIDQRRSARIDSDLIPGFPLAKVVSGLNEIVTPLLPAGYTVRFQGQAESLADLRVGALGALILGSLFIYMVMASLYESFVIPFAILMTLPLALIGAILALLVSGKFLDIYGMIGVILLMALVTKNAILLVDYAEQLRRQGMSRYEALIEAGLRRMRPIVMTTIAMIAGMIPVAIGYGEVNKIRAGIGITTIGGLISSTILSLIVIPCVYIYLDNVREWGFKMVNKYYGK